MNPNETIQLIQRRLDEAATPFQIIDELLPRNRTDALTWARHLLLWDEYRTRVSEQAVAVARIVSQSAIRAFNLFVSEQGQILERGARSRSRQPESAKAIFFITVGGEELRVHFRPDYFPRCNQDHFEFKSPHEPSRPHILSQTGYLSHFASSDAVEACGGAEAYAQLYAEAVRRGEKLAFESLPRDEEPEPPRKRRGRATARDKSARSESTAPTQPLPSAAPTTEAGPADQTEAAQIQGEHTRRVVAETSKRASPKPPTQRTLF